MTQIRNYSPISLCNVDYKNFSAIIAERLKKHLSKFIHPDQNGFLPRRQIKNNLRTITNVLEYYEIHPGKQVALVFLDVQKAFDNLSWQFLNLQLETMEFGQKFMNMIRALYQEQKAQINFNQDNTEKFTIEKGTRQGCPLSPLLFILTLEILNRNIRAEQEIKGLKIKGECFKLQAFADDLVFIIEDPIEVLPRLLKKYRSTGKSPDLK